MNPMSYQHEAHEFARYGENPMYALLGLSEECGEVAGKVAKFVRRNGGRLPAVGCFVEEDPLVDDWREKNAEFRKGLSKELGDVCWMVAELCTAYGLDLEEVMEENIAKLYDRRERGVIDGEGDDR